MTRALVGDAFLLLPFARLPNCFRFLLGKTMVSFLTLELGHTRGHYCLVLFWGGLTVGEGAPLVYFVLFFLFFFHIYYCSCFRWVWLVFLFFFLIHFLFFTVFTIALVFVALCLCFWFSFSVFHSFLFLFCRTKLAPLSFARVTDMQSMLSDRCDIINVDSFELVFVGLCLCFWFSF